MDGLIAGEKERLRLKADDDAIRKIEEAEREGEAADARESVRETQARGPRTTVKPNMKGLEAFDWEAYERQNARR